MTLFSHVAASRDAPLPRQEWGAYIQNNVCATRENGPALSPLGERVDRPGAFFSRGGPGEGVARLTVPVQFTTRR